MKTVVDGFVRRYDDSGSPIWIEPLIGIRDGLDLKRTHVIAVAVPMSGVAGIFGPSCIAAAQLAIAEVNKRSGIVGCELEALFLDTDHRRLSHLEREVRQLVDQNIVSGLVSMGVNEMRKRLNRVIGGRIPHVYTPPFDGKERSPNVFTIGKSPFEQLVPILPHISKHLRAKRWAVIGREIGWPRSVNLLARRAIADAGGSIVFERLLHGDEPFDANVIDEIAKAKPDIVFSALAGQEAVEFHRSYGHAGLDRRAFRFTEMVEENTLLSCGAGSTNRLVSVGSFFSTLTRDNSLSFLERYQSMHGATGPAINMFAQSVYEGIQFYSSLIQNRTLDLRGPVSYRTARGGVFHSNWNKEDPIFMAEADGINFRVLETLIG